MKKSNKIIIAIAAIVIIAGAIITVTKGFEFGLQYKDSQKIELNIGKEFNNSDVKDISKEVLNNQKIMIEKIEVYKDSVSITATQITEEQKEQIITKINEKYELEINSENIEIQDIAHVRGRDIIKPYIVPFLIATVAILAYMMIRYYKLNSFKVLIKTALTVVITQLVLISVIAIARLPIGRTTIPTVLLVYIISLIYMTSRFEKELKNKKIEEEKK